MRRLLVAGIAAGSAVTLGLVPDGAVAAFPGGNGRIAYSICPDLPVGPSCGGTPKLMTIAAGGGAS